MPSRRHTLAVAAGTTALLAGCLDEVSSDATSGDGTESRVDEPTMIVDTDVTTGVTVDNQFDDDPDVEYDSEQNVVTVRGRYSIGNACYDEYFPDPEYDEDADELRIEVSRRHDGRDECDDLDQQISYRVTVTIDGTPPGTIAVSENMGGETRIEP